LNAGYGVVERDQVAKILQEKKFTGNLEPGMAKTVGDPKGPSPNRRYTSVFCDFIYMVFTWYHFDMTTYQKLVRDKIPELLDKKGIAYEKRIATDDEYRTELIKKLVEESNEFAEAGSPDELADVLEVVEALRLLPEYHDVDSRKIAKREEKGAFNDRIILKGEKD
jgi:predicted house-cleaning noncanonical NTP pyrophosphatase (MazG superfamily)